MKTLSILLFLVFLSFFSFLSKAQNFPDSVKINKEINVLLRDYSKATIMVDSIWLKTNLSDSFQYSDPLNYNLSKIEYIKLYTKGVYKISKAESSIDQIKNVPDFYLVNLRSNISGDAGGQAVNGTYPFIFKVEKKAKVYKIRSIEVSQ
jgi:hypothetical protein